MIVLMITFLAMHGLVNVHLPKFFHPIYLFQLSAVYTVQWCRRARV